MTGGETAGLYRAFSPEADGIAPPADRVGLGSASASKRFSAVA